MIKTTGSVLVLLMVAIAYAVARSNPAVFEKETFAVGDIWKDCGDGKLVTINQVVITPDPPKRGDSVTAFVNVTLRESVTSGSIKVSVKDGFIPISTTLDLCTTLKDAGLSCPLPAEVYAMNITQKIPVLIPRGQVTGSIEVTDQNKAELACIDIDFKLE